MKNSTFSPPAVVLAAALLVSASGAPALERISETDASTIAAAACNTELNGMRVPYRDRGPYFARDPSVYWYAPTGRYYLDLSESIYPCEYLCVVDVSASGDDVNLRMEVQPVHEGARGRRELFECS